MKFNPKKNQKISHIQKFIFFRLSLNIINNLIFLTPVAHFQGRGIKFWFISKVVVFCWGEVNFHPVYMQFGYFSTSTRPAPPDDVSIYMLAFFFHHLFQTSEKIPTPFPEYQCIFFVVLERYGREWKSFYGVGEIRSFVLFGSPADWDHWRRNFQFSKEQRWFVSIKWVKHVQFFLKVIVFFI